MTSDGHREDTIQSAPDFNLHLIGSEPGGATPIEEDDLVDLIPDFVATRRDLNAVEYENIVQALPWANAQATRGGPKIVLSYQFLLSLHERMFGNVWKWAGKLRQRETNIGVDPSQISTRVKQTLDNALWWHEHNVFTVDERAARIHRRLVAVHPFPNGNGRCTRFVADLYLVSIEQPVFTWGARGQIENDGATRQSYLGALYAADGDDYEPLIRFARS